MVQAGVDQGAQYQSPERRMELICGFDEASALGLALAHHAQAPRGRAADAAAHRRRSGSAPAWSPALGRDGDTMRYYELNPADRSISPTGTSPSSRTARPRPTFCWATGGWCSSASCKANDAQNFDVLVLNAFRGASPPLHLMTKEAFDIYFGHLAENGILAVNFEIEMFEMAPLHRGLAKQLGSEVRWFEAPGRQALRRGDQLGALHAGTRSSSRRRAVRRAIARWRDGGSPRSSCGPTRTAT